MILSKSLELIDLNYVSKIYENRLNSYTALDNINFSASKGQLYLILGPSGSGKTTLLTIAAGFTKPSHGNVFLFGNNINDYSEKELQLIRANKIGFIFQTFLLIEALNVFENVALALKFSNKRKSSIKERTFDALEKVNISELSEKRPGQLSHGERQRVAIARAFASDAELIIADEPGASLNSGQSKEIISILHQYSSELNKCVIVASHDLRLKPVADKIIYLENGRITNETGGFK